MFGVRRAIHAELCGGKKMNCDCSRPDRNCEKCHRSATSGFTWTMPPWVYVRPPEEGWAADELIGDTISITEGNSNYYWMILCQYCGASHHPEACPRVKSIEYHDNGTVKKVELHPPPAPEPQPFQSTIVCEVAK